jgi:hypothetical protein
MERFATRKDKHGAHHNHARHNMKIKLVLLLSASLGLSSCVSAGLEFRDSFTGRVTAGERIVAGAIDLVTLPVQLPFLAAMQLSE